MKHNRAASTLGKLFLAFSFLFGIGICTSTTAQAQWQNDPYYRQNDRDYRREQRRREREARREQQRHQNRDYYGNNGYGYGNNGYGYGNNGYRDADGYGNYGGSFNLRQTALNAGFADGVKEGRKDRQHGDRYDFSDEGNFRSGDRDYSSRFGDRETYRRYYREAFQHGYDDGYNGY
jgi:hypothetical protein